MSEQIPFTVDIESHLERSSKFIFSDGIFSFWAAKYGSWTNNDTIIYRVRQDTTPEKRAWEKGIKLYDMLVPATAAQIRLWMEAHPNLIPKVASSGVALWKKAHPTLVKRLGEKLNTQQVDYVCYVIMTTCQHCLDANVAKSSCYCSWDE